MYRHFFAACIFVLVVVAVPACGELVLQNPPTIALPMPVEPIRIGISDSAVPLENDIRSAYELGPGQAKLVFLTGNDKTLSEELESGLLDAAIIYDHSKTEMFVKPIAFDALVFVLHPDVHISNIGLQTLRTLYNGTVTRWSTFGQDDLSVTLYVREAGSGPETIFSSKVVSTTKVTPNALISFSESDMASNILDKPGGLGYGFMGSLSEFNTLAIDGMIATPESIENQGYPLIARVYFVSKERPTGDLEHLLTRILSVYGQNLIGENYGRVR